CRLSRRPLVRGRVGTTDEAHQRLLSRGAGMPAPVATREDLQLAEGDGATRAHHLTDRTQPIALRRADQVELVLDGEDAALGREERVARVAPGAVGERAAHSRVKEPVLLGEVSAVVRLDDAPP